MAEVRYSPLAELAIDGIWHTIAHDNRAAADRFVLKLSRKAANAALQPQMGVARPDIAANARILIEGLYIIIYEPIDNGINVLNIIHGAREPGTWLS